MWPESATWTVGVIVVLFSATLALAVDYVYERMTRARPSHFLGMGSSVGNIVWRLAMLGLIAGALAYQHRAPFTTIRSMWTAARPPAMNSAVAIALLAVLYGTAALWSRLPVLGKWTASNPSSYKAGGRLSSGALVLLLMVRYPLTV